MTKARILADYVAGGTTTWKDAVAKVKSDNPKE